MNIRECVFGGDRGVTVIAVGKGDGELSSNPVRGGLYFIYHANTLRKR